MQVLGVEEISNLKYYRLQDDNGNDYIAEQLFLNKMPKSRIIADIKRNIEKTIIENRVFSNNPAYIQYEGLEQINGEYCLLRKGTEIYKPLYSYIKENRTSLEKVVEWIAIIGEMASTANKNGIRWNKITLNSLYIGTDGKLRLSDPDISNDLLKYRELQGIKPLEVYQGPEIFRDVFLEQQSLIYSLGVIMYYLAAGEMPFILTDKSDYSKSDLVHEIINTKPLEPSYINPRIGEGLNSFIMKVLNKDADKRIKTWEMFLQELKNIKKSGIYASKEEEESYRSKAEKVIRVSNRKKVFFNFWRKRWKLITVSLSVILILYLVNFVSQTDPYITHETTAEQVVEFFYQAIDEKNTVLLDETTTVDLKRLDNMVAESFVIERMRYAYEMSDVNNEDSLFGINDLELLLLSTGEEHIYKAEYIFYFQLSEEDTYSQGVEITDNNTNNTNNNTTDDTNIDDVIISERENPLKRYNIHMSDILYLKKVDNIWRIVNIEGSIVSVIEGRIIGLIEEQE